MVDLLKKQLRGHVEKIYLPLPTGTMELDIMAYDSNNNPKHRLMIDGLWEPFRAIGLIKFETTVLAFKATMELRGSKWKLNQLDSEMLCELAEKSSLFRDAYHKLTGEYFDKEKTKEVNPQLVDLIRVSLQFQQALNRVCGHWV